MLPSGPAVVRGRSASRAGFVARPGRRRQPPATVPAARQGGRVRLGLNMGYSGARLRPRLELDSSLQRRMVGLSWPLMLNNLISFSFFKIDVFLLESLQGNAVVGLYSVAYKFLDALQILPASFTIAVFPILSRYAASAKDSLMRAYLLSVRLLVIVALPIAVVTTFLAEPMVYLLGGSQYLPDSRIALQLMIWSVPIGFINSVTHYVLIALNQQRFLTKAFAIGLTFTVVANRVFIPIYSYRASALIHLFAKPVQPYAVLNHFQAGHGGTPGIGGFTGSKEDIFI